MGCNSTSVRAAEDGKSSMQMLVSTLSNVDDPSVLNALLRGMLKGLEGRRDVVAPGNWTPLVAKLDASGDGRTRELVSQLSQIFGDEAAIQRALAIVRDANASVEDRIRELTSLLSQQNREASDLLESLLDVPALQLSAVRGYAAIENTSAPSVLLKRYPHLSDELRRAVVETLSARKQYADALLASIQNETIRREDIPTHVARSLEALLGERFVDVFGELPKLGADREQQIAKWKTQITAAALAKADASRGRAVFQKTCGACHLLYGEGGNIGPDLTGSNRANLDYLLLNSVDPSYDVPAAYRMVTILTTDGRVVNGVVAEEDDTRVVLKTVENPRLAIAKSDVERRVVSTKSMMPDGQLDALKPAQVIDLVKYLKTTEQVELVK
ncbi:c-type cytochrome [Rubripirellula reticaptiva]|nr:c-type cytochrome [Rubripirellula reticaptiva]